MINLDSEVISNWTRQYASFGAVVFFNDASERFSVQTNIGEQIHYTEADSIVLAISKWVKAYSDLYEMENR